MNYSRKFIVGIAIGETRECFKLCIPAGYWKTYGAAPNVPVAKRPQIKPSYYSKVVRATFESEEEVWMRCQISIDNLTRRQHDLLHIRFGQTVISMLKENTS